MLLLRPLLRSNHWRKKQTHIYVFFIFLVSNIGGGLSPLGDPPLFIAFLKGNDHDNMPLLTLIILPITLNNP